MAGRRKDHLSSIADDQEWKAGVAPLGKRKSRAAHEARIPEKINKAKKDKPPAAPSARGASKNSGDEKGPLRAIDPRELEKISKGKRPVEAKLDLHFMTQGQALPALIRFVADAHARGLRTLQIITGAGRQKTGGGVLRRAVPEWLASSNVRQHISGLSLEPSRWGKEPGSYFLTLRR